MAIVGFYLTLPLVLFGLLRLIITSVNYFSKPVLPSRKPGIAPLISVILIPEESGNRNSEIIGDLINQTYSNIEIIVNVYQPRINDQNPHLKDSRIKTLQPEQPPAGWNMRNYTCHQMADRAKGEYILFINSNIRLDKSFIEDSISNIQARKLVLLTTLPDHKLSSFSEGLFRDNLYWIALSLIPFPWIRKRNNPSFSFTSGEMMMIETTVYHKNSWYEKFKSILYPEIFICRELKRQKLHIATLLGSEKIRYTSSRQYKQVIQENYEKIVNFFDGNSKYLIIWACVSTLSPILIILLQPYPFVFLFLFSLILSKMMVAALCEQSTFRSLILMPIQHFTMLHMMWLSIRKSRSS